ncbi:MAG: CHRD domain-containing protein [Anditalea sp.]
MKFNLKNCFQIFNLLIIGMIITSSCANDEEVEFSNIEINGKEEVPPNDSNASGTFDGTYDKTTKTLTYTLTFTGIEPTNMHFHNAPEGENGPVVIPIGEDPYSSPIEGTTSELTTEQETDLLDGNWYVNIHSEEFPPGEIRGQLVQ